jgi:hypothetical protein
LRMRLLRGKLTWGAGMWHTQAHTWWHVIS